MNKKLALLAVAVLSVGLAGNAYAHTSEIVGDYKVEIGWIFEPPVAGMKNAIEITVVSATDAEKETASSDGQDNGKRDAHDDSHNSMDEDSKGNMTHASDGSDTHVDREKKTARKASGIPGLGKTLEADITLGNEKTFLRIIESKFRPGVYYGVYSPEHAGFPLVHVVGDIKGTVFEVTFHPERVEEKQ